jgi:hypothetical protein
VKYLRETCNGQQSLSGHDRCVQWEAAKMCRGRCVERSEAATGANVPDDFGMVKGLVYRIA